MLKRIIVFLGVIIAWAWAGTCLAETSLNVFTRIDKFSGRTHVVVPMPDSLPDVVWVESLYRVSPDDPWRPAAVTRYRSLTAENILRNNNNDTAFGREVASNVVAEEMARGMFRERLAAGKQREIVWHTTRQFPKDFTGEVQFRVRLLDEERSPLAEATALIDIDHTDQIILDDFGQAIGDDPENTGWVWRPPSDDEPGVLEVIEQPNIIDPLVIPLDLSGYYAIYVMVPDEPVSSIDLRLSGELFPERFAGTDRIELFWQVAEMDGQNLVIHQPYRTVKGGENSLNDDYRARLTRVRMVPVSRESYEQFDRFSSYERDKDIVAFFEPYSWAFNELVNTGHKFIEPLAAFNEARVDLIEFQVGRLGARMIYPTKVDIPLYGEAKGDSVPGGGSPRSMGVGVMVTQTHPWQAGQIAANAFNIPLSANFGAGIAYPHSPIGSPIFRSRPEWTDETGVFPQYNRMDVRKHFLGLYRELLDMGAKAVTVDFCRYPFVSDSPQITLRFLTELRELTRRYGDADEAVELRVRYPVEGVRGNDGQYLPEVWIKKNLVDVLMPSGVAMNVQYFDCRPIIEATRGTPVRVLPMIEATNGGPVWPGMAIQRIHELYRWGADGIMIYQADSMIVGSMVRNSNLGLRQIAVRHLGSRRAVEEMYQQIGDRQGDFSTDIYLDYPSPYQSNRVHAWVEGGQPLVVEFYMDGELINRDEEPPFVLGKDGYKNNYPASGRPVELLIRANIDGDWLEKTATIPRIYPASH